ncbi:5,10-methylenetetrahydrofolate reductase [Nocardioides marmoriginsengisoli]|uniref:5,10-methylenetetrahydrofolate reductase n=1 Tax=Nocardioides marmoriginsengisoli TaxID=661483 RepID=A0A3N0CLI7_9ACTN|nr:methylenetetrahydrofolate reductase [Nocardioides marmoriginsengisoli]RNL64335.1 5,10-methylenetetrahydrofolate reductase [Nocardioides marmoriginsengisoli]
MSLTTKVSAREGELLLFSLTPPKESTAPAEVDRIAEVTLERLAGLDLDGLILYDIDDESERNPEARPFPYLPTLDPAVFYADNLAALDLPVVIYRCVGKYDPADLEGWLAGQDVERVLTVFVGAASRTTEVRTGLAQAHEVRKATRPELLVGGVAIPERHAGGGDEHLRLIRKQGNGCSFFISQVVYDVAAAKDLLSDYVYACRDQGSEPVPVVFTLSVCGSYKTLTFLEWLGVQVPRWLRNELAHSDDTLAVSYEHCVHAAAELAEFARRLRVPFGFNVESVSNRKVEIDASVDLVREVAQLLRR